MHDSVREFVSKTIIDRNLSGLEVLDVGSYDINGSVKPLFEDAGCDYTGVDIIAGPGVDFVMDANALQFLDAAFDVCCCCEMIEHDRRFWLSLSEMGRVLRRGGLLILTTRGNGFQYHEPPDYWRFQIDAPSVWAELSHTKTEAVVEDPQVNGIFYVGVKE